MCLTSKNELLSYFYSKNGYNSVEYYCIGKTIKIILKTTYKKLVQKYHYNARFPSLCLVSENAFMSYFHSKNSHNSMENHRIQINFKLVPKTSCKKLFLKCQDNARFPSLSLASQNVFLSYFYSKKCHNSEGNYLIRKQLHLF